MTVLLQILGLEIGKILKNYDFMTMTTKVMKYDSQIGRLLGLSRVMWNTKCICICILPVSKILLKNMYLTVSFRYWGNVS